MTQAFRDFEKAGPHLFLKFQASFDIPLYGLQLEALQFAYFYSL